MTAAPHLRKSSMAAEDLVKETYSVPRQARDARTLLGGMRLNARTTLFVFFGLVAIVAMSALLYVTDQRMSRAIGNLESSSHVSALVNRVETLVTTLTSDGNNFALSRNTKFAEAYTRESGNTVSVLTGLRGIPAALDAQKLVITLADGITQHATHFQNIIRLQSILGSDGSAGLTGNAAVSGAALENGLRNVPAPRLISEMAVLRKMERGLRSIITEENAKSVSDALNNMRQSVTASSLSARSKKALTQRIQSYAADMNQLARTRLLQSNEISRLDEVAAYVTPNLTALTKFSVSLRETARAEAEVTRMEVRRILLSGALIVLLALTLVGALLIRSIAHPVTDLATAAVQLARGNRSGSIPALANYDETGDVANALVYFRENMAQADRIRQELEDHLKNTRRSTGAPGMKATAPKSSENAITSTLERTAPQLPYREIVRTPVSKTQPPQAHAANPVSPSGIPTDISANFRASLGTPLSSFSQQVAQTSQNASNAAKGAEQCDFMVSGLAESREKIDDIERLMASISDQMSLLAVQIALFSELPPDDPENLLMLSGRHLGKDGDHPNSPSVNDRIETLQNGTKRAISAIQQIGKTIEDVNRVAVEFAANASNDALDAATELLRQSEDLRGMLDDLLGRIKSEEQTGAGS